MKFELTANGSVDEGFKLKVQADSNEELKVCSDLTEKLIEKITTIEIKINQSNEY